VTNAEFKAVSYIATGINATFSLYPSNIKFHMVLAFCIIAFVPEYSNSALGFLFAVLNNLLMKFTPFYFAFAAVS